MVSTPGAGKTALLEYTLTRMRGDGTRVAALVGDLATENDARRLARSEAPVKQIVTGTICHLDADMVQAPRRLEALGILTFCLSRTSAISSVRRVTTWANSWARADVSH